MRISIKNRRTINPPKTIIRNILSLFSNPNLIEATPKKKLKVEKIKPQKRLKKRSGLRFLPIKKVTIPTINKTGIILKK